MLRQSSGAKVIMRFLAGVKARVGVDPDKVGTSFAPQLATWLNQERWKALGDGAGMNSGDGASD
jgi:hypothetical protein